MVNHITPDLGIHSIPFSGKLL